jgi:DNA-binding response OmpR family regulator
MAYSILVVDDEENMLALLERVLGKEGYHIACANSAQLAMHLARRHSFQLAIVDVFMPELDGIDMLKKLKAIHSDMPVVMMSAFPSWEKEEAARQLGCDDYLLKPLDMKHLKALIKQKVRQLEDKED